MIAPDLETAIDELQDLLASARTIAPFTGAGISTECGIPDFRSPGGIWTKNRPRSRSTNSCASQQMRDEAWRRRFAMDAQFAAARPGRGHLALASLYRAGKAPAVITQNIDNLHQSSGFAAEHVIELHGNTSYALCLGCAKRYELAWVRQPIRADQRAVHPTAPTAAGTSRPPPSPLARRCPSARCSALNCLTLDCDVFLAVGSSLVVWPAAGFPATRQANRFPFNYQS